MVALAICHVHALSATSSIIRREELSTDVWQTAECHIFTYFNYSHGIPLFVQKNLESWALHSHGRCGPPILVNDTNVKQFVPDVPAEYYKLPYPSAVSDAIRYALLFHNGGIYMDTDFLVVQDMTEILNMLVDHDFISYAGEGDHCDHGEFSSNFIAGRKGSPLYGAIWEAQKLKLGEHCTHSNIDERAVCCFDDAALCHVPWAALGEGISRKVFAASVHTDETLKYYCFEGNRSFVPRGFSYVLEHIVKLAPSLEFLSKTESNPMDRMMYHLFASLGFEGRYSGARLFDPKTLVGALYQKSGVELNRPTLEEGRLKELRICAHERETCDCHGQAFYIQNFGMTEKDIEKAILETEYLQEEVQAQILCQPGKPAGFEYDPASGSSKHCLCLPKK